MGRTKLGNVLFAQRVPPELAVKLKAYVADWKARGGVVPPSASNGLESKGMGGYGPVYHKVLGGAVQVDPFYKGDADPTEVTLLKREVDVAKDQEKKAWDEVTRLQGEVDRLEKASQEFNDKEMSWYVSDESEKVRWMAGLLKKSKVGGNPFDQGEASC